MKLSTHAPINCGPRHSVSNTETAERRSHYTKSAIGSNYHWMTSGPACCVTALLSALLTAHIMFRLQGDDQLAITANAAYESPSKRALVTKVKADQSSRLLSSYLSQQTSDVKQQMRFVASLIQQHKRSIEDSEKLAYLIVSESFRANYDALFVAAVIKAESTFKHSAVSNRGARGLMQILPTTARYVSQQGQVKWSPNTSLHDPANNIKLGIAYLKYLEKKFNGNREKVLIAYNWGPGNLIVAMRRGGRVPGQSIQYARQILFNHRKWRSSYSGPDSYTITARGNSIVRPKYS